MVHFSPKQASDDLTIPESLSAFGLNSCFASLMVRHDLSLRPLSLMASQMLQIPNIRPKLLFNLTAAEGSQIGVTPQKPLLRIGAAPTRTSPSAVSYHVVCMRTKAPGTHQDPGTEGDLGSKPPSKEAERPRTTRVDQRFGSLAVRPTPALSTVCTDMLPRCCVETCLLRPLVPQHANPCLNSRKSRQYYYLPMQIRWLNRICH
ncbi:hypothetical protein BDP67DRAFT_284584 [Colletotrichum lupini]|nr:hypothetical protein BDP67DRAFT_284584 [Colletotrichum lupini]